MTKHDLLNDIHARVVRLETLAEGNKELLSDLQKKVNHLEHVRGVIATMGGILGAIAGLVGSIVVNLFTVRNGQ
jgi:hypothetical protein